MGASHLFRPKTGSHVKHTHTTTPPPFRPYSLHQTSIPPWCSNCDHVFHPFRRLCFHSAVYSLRHTSIPPWRPNCDHVFQSIPPSHVFIPPCILDMICAFRPGVRNVTTCFHHSALPAARAFQPFCPAGGEGIPPFRPAGGEGIPPFRPAGGEGIPPCRRRGHSTIPGIQPFRPAGGEGIPPLRHVLTTCLRAE